MSLCITRKRGRHGCATTVNLGIAKSIIASVALAASVQGSHAAGPTFEQIPTLPPATGLAFSEAFAVSGDGKLVVGFSQSATGIPQAFTFQNGALAALDPSFSGTFSAARGVSDDGSVIVGELTVGAGQPTAFYWTAGSGMVAAPPMLGGNSFANGVSGNGKKIIGTMGNGSLPQRAFVWDRKTGTVTDIGTLKSDLSGLARANGVDDSGNVVVGGASARNGFHAFRWTPTGGMQDLGTIGGVKGFSEAHAVSGDGLVVVGRSAIPAPVDNRAFRWSEGTGMVQLLAPNEADLRETRALAVSQDGTYVAGFTIAQTPKRFRAIRWDGAGTGMYLGDLTPNNDGNSRATGISDDGSIVVGVSEFDASTNLRGFIWRENRKAPGGTMLDHVNTLAQVAQGAADQASAAATIANLAQFVLGQEIAAPSGGLAGEALSSRGEGGPMPIAMRVSIGASRSDDDNDAVVGGLTAATALTPSLTLGGYIGLGSDNNTLGSFGIDGNFTSYGLFLRNGAVGGEGLTWKVAAAQTRADVDITRSTQLANTETGAGSSEMRAQAASVELGYGMRYGTAHVTPFARLARSSVTRDGYTETGNVAFPVTYDDYEITATVATLGANVGKAVSDAGWLSFSAGVEWDLSRNSGPVTGTSDIPGMTNFSIAGPITERDRRVFAEVRYTHQLGNGRAFDIGIGATQTPYSKEATAMASIGYQMNF